VNQGPYQQYLYDQYNPNQNVTYANSGSGVNPRGQNLSQISNNNPSIITFQKEVNPRSILGDNTINSQLRGASINLQQIDEQLQMSRKLFPS
jgi:hypothetical protein